MALYTIDEFASKVQSDVDTATAVLLRDLVTGLISETVGDSFDVDSAPVTVKAIALTAASRDYTNPSGYTSTTVAIDDYSTTNRRDGVGANLYLTDEELAMLQALYPTTASTRSFTISPFYEPPTSPIESWA